MDSPDEEEQIVRAIALSLGTELLPTDLHAQGNKQEKKVNYIAHRQK